jgi:Leucine-rich repeat (LRR) protein
LKIALTFLSFQFIFAIELKCRTKNDDYRYGISEHDLYKKEENILCACKLKKLKLHENKEDVKISKIEKCKFKGNPEKEVEALHIYDSDIKVVNPKIYEKFEHLILFVCSDCGIRKLEPNYFNIKTLKYFRLEKNHIYELTGKVFQNLPALEKINLCNNEIIVIGNDTFSGLTNLQGLYLYKNGIQYLEPEVFRDLVNLRDLFLDNNKLEMIPSQLFEKNINLERVTLHNNNIFWMASVFGGIGGLRNLSLSGNDCVNENFIFPDNENLKQIESSLSNCSQGAPTYFHIKFKKNFEKLTVTFNTMYYNFTSQLDYANERFDRFEMNVAIIFAALAIFVMITVISLILIGYLAKNLIMQS